MSQSLVILEFYSNPYQYVGCLVAEVVYNIVVVFVVVGSSIAAAAAAADVSVASPLSCY